MERSADGDGEEGGMKVMVGCGRRVWWVDCP